MVGVNRKEGESFESMMRRFSKKLQQSGNIYRARKTRFFERPKSKDRRRLDAIRRSGIREEKEELRKQGQLQPTRKSHY